MAPSALVRRRLPDLLSRVLAEPRLVEAVRALPAPALGQLVRHVGLEDLGEIVALATPDQLARVLDEDLWRSDRPGEDERFDDERFALWLEVLLESGDAALAERLAALPDELVALGLHRQVLVLDLDALALEVAAMEPDEADRVEHVLDGQLACEIDRFRVVSRRHDGWDAVLAVLLALDERHPDHLRGLLERLCAAGEGQRAEHDGLCEALEAAEVIESDAAADREDRRAAAGFVSAATARSFLALAERDGAGAALERDPVTRAYFRDLEPEPAGEPAPGADAAGTAPALLALLERAAAEAGPARPQLAAAAVAPEAAAFFAAMKALAADDPAAHRARAAELAYLVNVLLAGAGRDGRPLQPVEAIELAAETCGRGLAVLAGRTARGPADPDARAENEARLRETPADALFRVGWRLRGEAGRGAA